MSVRPRILAIAAVLAFASATSPSVAQDDARKPPTGETKASCANAAEQGQSLRQSTKLRAAREKFLRCARPECPEVVRVDCAEWLREAEAALPTVVLVAREARGKDVIDARVAMDGAPLVTSLDGKAIGVDPGPHRFHFETSGADPVDVGILVAEGERNRAVVATFGAKLTSSGARDDESAPALSTTNVAPPEEPPSASRSRLPIGPLVVGGIGVVALGAFAVLDATAWSDVNRLRDGCGRTQSCSPSEVDAIDGRITFAKIALGVGAVALATGVTWLVVDRVSVRPTSGGAMVETSTTF